MLIEDITDPKVKSIVENVVTELFYQRDAAIGELARQDEALQSQLHEVEKTNSRLKRANAIIDQLNKEFIASALRRSK